MQHRFTGRKEETRSLDARERRSTLVKIVNYIVE